MSEFDPRCLLEDVRYILCKSVATVVRPMLEDALLNKDKPFAEVKAEWHWAGTDYVTPIDKANERFLLSRLFALLPEAAIVGEEMFEGNAGANTAVMKSGYCWVVDPLDGTNNVARYIQGQLPAGEKPSWGVMATLLKDGQPVAGWTYYDLAGQEQGIVYGGFGLGIFHDEPGKPETRRKLDFNAPLAPGVAENSVMTTIGSYPKDCEALMQDAIAKNRITVPEPYLRSAAVEGALFLLGRTAAKSGSWFRVWDHGAGFALTKEAGGHAALMNGEDFDAAQHGRNGVLFARSKEDWVKTRRAMMGETPYVLVPSAPVSKGPGAIPGP